MAYSFDVLVAGAGPAGSTAALQLSRSGFSVGLIEKEDYGTPRVGETLPPMIRPQLTELGVWEHFLECHPLESYGIQTAWETPSPRHQDFLRNPYGCGWHVDRARFDAMLASAAAREGAELFVSTRIVSCSMQSGGEWLLEAARDGTELTLNGRMLVDATGRKALFASRQGSQARAADRMIGAVTFCETSDSAQWTLIEAVDDGWWYSAPLPGARMVFAYMTDSDLWRNLEWTELVKRAPLTFERAGCLPVPPPFQIVSAASVLRHPVAGANWMAVGDAALAFDPLSGQGISKSIETGARCSAAVARWFAGDSGALSEYQSWVNQAYESYLVLRRQFYSSVVRFPGSPFWDRRATA